MSIRMHRGALATAAAMTLVISGCASFSGPEEDAEEAEDTESVEETDDDDDADEADVEEAAAAEEDEDDSEAAAEPDPELEEASGAAVGEVVVGGVRYEITDLRNCEPEAVIEGQDWELELQAYGYLDGDRHISHIYVWNLGGSDFEDVSWQGPEGVFTSDGQAELHISDGRVTGTASLVDALTMEGDLSYEVDVPVPEETIDCGF